MAVVIPKYIDVVNTFYYSNGILFRKKNNKKAGTKLANGYISINLDGKRYLAHKLIYYYEYGVWPDVLDHIDRDKTNNKIENLRPASKSLNEANTGPRKNNTSGLKGVSFHKKANKWRAYIKETHLGLFSTAQDAARAYNKAAYSIYKDFAYLNEVDNVLYR